MEITLNQIVKSEYNIHEQQQNISTNSYFLQVFRINFFLSFWACEESELLIFDVTTLDSSQAQNDKISLFKIMKKTDKEKGNQPGNSKQPVEDIS